MNQGGGDYRLAPGSPCIDAGDSTTVWLVGITLDLDGNLRFVDDPDTADTGVPDGNGAVVDMGPYEVQDPCLSDLDGDGMISIIDLLDLLAAWGPCPGCPADINGDGQVNIADLLLMLAAWGPC